MRVAYVCQRKAWSRPARDSDQNALMISKQSTVSLCQHFRWSCDADFAAGGRHLLESAAAGGENEYLEFSQHGGRRVRKSWAGR